MSKIIHTCTSIKIIEKMYTIWMCWWLGGMGTHHMGIHPLWHGQINMQRKHYPKL